MRRFERVVGNKASYWEIEHFEDLVITRQGVIGRAAKDKEKAFQDDAEAEDEYAKMIHAKRRLGWIEVDEPSEPIKEIEERAMKLVPLDGSAPETFTGPAMKYLLWRMIEVELFDRHCPPPDMSRWEYRAMRKLRLDEVPTEGSPNYDAFVTQLRELSPRGRAAKMVNSMVGAYKFREGSHWIVASDECAYIASGAAHRKPKRRKETAQQSKWVKQWIAFHERATAGYEAIPVDA